MKFAMRLQAFSAAKSKIVPSALGPRLRLLHTSTSLASTPTPKHTPDTYSKEVDTTPVIEKAVNRLNPDSDSVQRPDEPPSGPWSRAAAMTGEYTHVESGKQSYTPTKGKAHYDAKGDWAEEKGAETGAPDAGPDAKSRQGGI